ncbi:MAG: hypothetical protein EHM61_09155 [Acidobacteria bacterium]|nr:MAG: hypothetical protein EHM61_09155 [Acidobacteriota bacterium]
MTKKLGVISRTSCLAVFLGIAFVTLLSGLGVPADQIVWETVDPGGNGWLHCGAIHPRSGHLFFSSDMSLSLLRSTDQGMTWTPIANPDAGTAHGIVGDPTDPNTLYMNQMGVVPATSGIWKSTDDGDTWRQIYRGDDFGMSRGQSGVVDPANNSALYWTAADMGVRRSTDGGLHWSDLSQGLPKDRIVQDRHLNELELDHNSPVGRRTLYYPTNLGLYRMDEPAATWKLVAGLPAASCSDVTVCNRGVVFAAFPDRGLFKSTDGGKSWVARESGLDGKRPLRVLATKSRPEMVYVATVRDEGIYGSQDGGESFRLLTHRRYNSSFNWPTNYRQHEGVSAQVLFIDPNDPYTLYTDYSKKTHDGGQTWEHYGTREVRRDRWRGEGLCLLTDYRVVFDPNRPKIVWFGFSDTGLMLSEDGGETIINLITFHRGEVNQGAYWRDKLVHSSGSCVSMAVDPELSTTIYASISTKNASADRASVGGIVIKSVDSGWNWEPLYEKHGLDDGIVRSIVIDPSSPVRNRTVFVASYPNGVYRSEDDGKSFRCVTPAAMFGGNTRVMWLEMAPSDPKVLYLAVGGSYGIRPIGYGPQVYPALDPGMNGGVFKTTDGGDTWQKCNKVRELPNVQDIAVHPTDPNIVFAASGPEEYLAGDKSCPQETREGGVFASMDGGINWQRVFTPPRAEVLGRAEVQAICINPVAPEILYAAVQPYGIYRTLDSGQNWELIGKESMDRRQRRYHSVDLNPHNPAEVWVAHFGNSFSRCIDESARQFMEQAVKRTNFVHNPGFEQVHLATERPADWSVEQPDPPSGERPVIRLSDVQVSEGRHSLHFLLTPAYANAPSQLPAEREQRRLEQEGKLQPRPAAASARFKGPTNSWVFQKIDPYFTSLMRGRRVAVEMDVYIVDRNLPQYWSRGTEAGEIPRDPPQVYLTEVRDYNVHWMVAETSLEDLEPTENIPASRMKNRWYRCRAVGRVSEDALSTRITVSGIGLDSGPMDLYIDNVSLTIVE